MNNQLALLDDEDAGRYRQLDEHTRDIGRRGVALVRAALRQTISGEPGATDGAAGPNDGAGVGRPRAGNGRRAA
ncbi:MAG: hypothetical protein LC721_09870 [Actinobacteria bacterium]|nr:hypothetical protein [Actinomycetota bacterium]